MQQHRARQQEQTPETDPEPIVFKCEANLWDMMATLNPDRRSALKPFDMRRWSLSDDRIYRLSWGKPNSMSTRLQIPSQCSSQQIIYDEKTVSFLNKDTDELLHFEYLGLEFADFAPGWCFLLLGKCLEPLPAGIRLSLGDEGG